MKYEVAEWRPVQAKVEGTERQPDRQTDRQTDRRTGWLLHEFLIWQHNPLKLHIVYTKNQFAKAFRHYKCYASHWLAIRVETANTRIVDRILVLIHTPRRVGQQS